MSDVRPIDANALQQELFDADWMLDNDEHMAQEIVENQTDLSLNTLRDAIYADAVAHGLWEDVDKAAEREASHVELKHKEAVRDIICSIQAAKRIQDEVHELSLATKDGHFEEVQEELADVVIMCFSVAGYLGIDIDAAIRRKMEINKSRPWKHGKE